MWTTTTIALTISRTHEKDAYSVVSSFLRLPVAVVYDFLATGGPGLWLVA